MKKSLLLLTIFALFFCGEPVSNSLTIIKKKYFTIWYDQTLRVPSYTFYYFTKKNRSHKVKRSDSFHKEDKIASDLQAGPSDYKNTGFDKGHFVPNNDMLFTATAEKENMTYANVAPQVGYFNQHLWLSIEEEVRRLGDVNDTLEIYTGGVYNKDCKKIGKDIAIPDSYFKTILIKNNGVIIGAEAFLCKNETPTIKEFENYVVPIDSVEKMIGKDLYASYKDEIEAKFEASKVVLK